MSSTENLDIEAGVRLAPVPGADPAPRRVRRRRDAWLHIGAPVLMALPLAGRPGHGRTAFVRRQPVRIVDGRLERGHTDVFELICPSCGDHPYLDYSEVPPRLQQLRGPGTLQAALDAYHQHLGLDQDGSGSSDGRATEKARATAPRAEAAGDCLAGTQYR
jgi:hypothetical protein